MGLRCIMSSDQSLCLGGGWDLMGVESCSHLFVFGSSTVGAR